MVRMIKSRRMRWGGRCSTNGEEEEPIEAIGGKARWKETSRKIKT
jgi:hypothetical protein